jgi:replicative DNA helicase
MAPGGHGKALALDTPLITPTGWTTMGDVQVGDELFDEQGQVCHVTYKSPIWLNHDCYEVQSNSCTPIVADADHLWLVTTDNRSSPQIHDTRFIAKKRCKSSPSVPPTKQLDLPEVDLPIAPYTLGVWLGDGDTDGARISQGAQDKQFVREQIELDGYATTEHKAAINFGILKLKTKLRELGVLGNKHIPQQYLRASAEQRLSLLQGLIDTDGHVSPRHDIEFCSTKWKLAYDVL